MNTCNVYRLRTVGTILKSRSISIAGTSAIFGCILTHPRSIKYVLHHGPIEQDERRLPNSDLVAKLSNYCLGKPRPVSGLATSASFRFIHSASGACDAPRSHTDVEIPSYDHYRRGDGKDPSIRRDQQDRGAFHYFILGNLGWASAMGTKAMCEMFVYSMSAAADVKALATIEVELDSIPEGKNMTFTWRGKPLFVKHRTAKEIETEKAVDLSKLRDPEKDEDRTLDPKWLVVIGICTHLGCVPIAFSGDYGAYYCPCHGSHYDWSGRIRKGPAPLNLEVPPQEIKDGLLIVG